jgi:hypothetical protein
MKHENSSHLARLDLFGRQVSELELQKSQLSDKVKELVHFLIFIIGNTNNFSKTYYFRTNRPS